LIFLWLSDPPSSELEKEEEEETKTKKRKVRKKERKKERKKNDPLLIDNRRDLLSLLCLTCTCEWLLMSRERRIWKITA